MRIFKYTAFFFILGIIFIQVYRKSDNKGLRRFLISFRIAGLISDRVEASEHYFSNNLTSIERLISNREFNSLDQNDRQVILAKAEGKGSNTPGGVHGFPITPAPKRPVRPPSGYTPKIGSRIPPKVVDQRLGAGANPAGAGGAGENADFDDQCPVPQKEQAQESHTSYSDYPQKKKKQCKLEDNLNNIPEFGSILEGSVVPVESLLGTSSGLKSQYKKLKKNSTANKQGVSAIRKLAEGSLKIGDKNVRKITGMKKVYEAKTKYARVYFQMDGDTVQILLPALKTDQKQSIKLLKKYFK